MLLYIHHTKYYYTTAAKDTKDIKIIKEKDDKMVELSSHYIQLFDDFPFHVKRITKQND
jgi:hypothetical protein